MPERVKSTRTLKPATTEEEFKALFERSLIAKIRYDAQGYPETLNDAAVELIGVTNASAVANISLLSTLRIPDAEKQKLRQGNAIQYEQRYDFDNIKQSGDFPISRSGVSFLDVHIVPIFSSEGVVAGYVGEFVDITARNQAEKVVRETAETVHILNEELRSANEELWIANEELELKAQERSSELSTTNEELKAANQELNIRNAELRHEIEQRIRAEKTAHRHAQLSETLSRIICAGNNADSLKTALAAMLDTALDLLPLTDGGIFMRDGDAVVLQHARGYNSDQFAWAQRIPLNRPVTARVMGGTPVFFDDYQVEISSDLREINKDVGSMAIIPLVAGDATLGYYLVANRGHKHHFTSQERELLTSIGQEAGTVIARLQAEEELQRYSERLEATVEKRTAELKDAERLAGIGETAAMIGHDLRNPLQGLQYIVDLQKLRFKGVPPEKRTAEDWQKEAELFDRITEQVFYMDKIVGDLQDYARPLDPEREAVSVPELIGDVLRSLPQSEGKVYVNADLPDLTIKAEPHLMHRLFSNLALNAMQAMPAGGILTVSAAAADGSVAISVSDTGAGIPDELRSKLFAPLMTGKAKGTGLGLAVVKRIAEAHGGTITFESERGKGTTFTVTLPVG